MKIMVIRWGTMESLPPAINLIRILVDLGHNVLLVANELNGQEWSHSEKIEILDLGPYPKPNEHLSLVQRLKSRQLLRKVLIEREPECDLIWTTSDNSAVHCCDLIPPEKHILQLAELVEYVPLLGSLSLFKSKRIENQARAARCVVVPEINRAYIQKVWWNLPDVPAVLPNKPYFKSSADLHMLPEPDYIDRFRRTREKVILYQGGFTPDRGLEPFCAAIDAFEGEYVLGLMGPDSEYRKKLCASFMSVQYFGVYPAPFHLFAAEHCFAGILPYRSNGDRIAHLSKLNSLYCAPNKIWEYSLAGIPMIANELPGIKTLFDNYNMGICVKEGDEDEIIRAIKTTKDNRIAFCANSELFYKSIDLREVICNILDG